MTDEFKMTQYTQRKKCLIVTAIVANLFIVGLLVAFQLDSVNRPIIERALGGRATVGSIGRGFFPFDFVIENLDYQNGTVTAESIRIVQGASPLLRTLWHGRYVIGSVYLEGVRVNRTKLLQSKENTATDDDIVPDPKDKKKEKNAKDSHKPEFELSYGEVQIHLDESAENSLYIRGKLSFRKGQFSSMIALYFNEKHKQPEMFEAIVSVFYKPQDGEGQLILELPTLILGDVMGEYALEEKYLNGLATCEFDINQVQLEGQCVMEHSLAGVGESQIRLNTMYHYEKGIASVHANGNLLDMPLAFDAHYHMNDSTFDICAALVLDNCDAQHSENRLAVIRHTVSIAGELGFSDVGGEHDIEDLSTGGASIQSIQYCSAEVLCSDQPYCAPCLTHATRSVGPQNLGRTAAVFEFAMEQPWLNAETLVRVESAADGLHLSLSDFEAFTHGLSIETQPNSNITIDIQYHSEQNVQRFMPLQNIHFQSYAPLLLNDNPLVLTVNDTQMHAELEQDARILGQLFPEAHLLANLRARCPLTGFFDLHEIFGKREITACELLATECRLVHESGGLQLYLPDLYMKCEPDGVHYLSGHIMYGETPASFQGNISSNPSFCAAIVADVTDVFGVDTLGLTIEFPKDCIE